MKCEICGKEFKCLGVHVSKFHNLEPEEYYKKYISKQRYCISCNKPTKFVNIKKGYNKFCSNKCSNNSEEVKIKQKKTLMKNYGVDIPLKSKEIQKKIKQTNLEKYGVENLSILTQIKEKKKQTCLKNFGVENPFQSEEVKEKSRKTCLEKYGVEHNTQSEEVKEKIRQTNLKIRNVEFPMQSKQVQEKSIKTTLKNYGVENPFQSEEIKEKKKQTNLNNLGVEYPGQSKQVINKIRRTRRKKYYKNLLTSDRLKKRCIPLFKQEDYKGDEEKYPWICVKCNTEFKDNLNDGHIPRCSTCYPYYKSVFEQEISNFCKQFFPNLIENDRSVLEGHELDIYIPSINLAIECDGLYWHSEEQGKDKNYHLDKTNQCQKNGIKLIHIFEDEWLNNKNKIKKILLKEFGIIKRDTNFKDKMTVDLRFSNGDYLLENGYKLVEILKPRCYYINGLNRTKRKPRNKSFNKIWDCGNKVFATGI